MMKTVASFVGTEVHGYRILEWLDGGAQGDVYRAQRTSIDQQVAIKIIKPEYANEPEFIRRFEAEAQLIAHLEHPHITPLYDYWRNPDGAYLVMRFVGGGSVHTAIAQGQITPATTAQIIAQVASALDMAHRNGIVHRDIKPKNILLDSEGNAYLADFGIAIDIHKQYEDGSEDGFTGTMDYSSPEQFMGEAVQNTSDIFSLGITVYEMLARHHPFHGFSRIERPIKIIHDPLPQLPTLADAINDKVNAVIQRATAKDPAARYQSATEFADALSYALGIQKAAPLIPVEAMRNPYKGLLPFQLKDARDFFGREEAVTSLLQRMDEAHLFKRFLAVIGASGSGKSSLVKAGLLPALAKNALENSAQWFVVDMLPTPQPLEELETALISVARQVNIDISEVLHQDKYGLLRVAELILPEDSSQLLLVVDQFEELFTRVEAEATRKHFLDLIYTAVTAVDSRVRVIITLRADYYDRPLHYPEFGELLRQRIETVLPLSAKEIERVITAPAERVGVLFEPELVSEIVADMTAQIGALPLLQYALTELFEYRDANTIHREAYETIGRAVGALAKRAEDLYAGLETNGQALTRQMFLRLVTLGEGTEDTRRRILRGELQSLVADAHQMDAIIDLFAAYRLISLDRDSQTRQPTVEVAHEAILREWERLRQWLRDSRADIRQHQSLSHAAHQWHESNQATDYLLRGIRLEQAEVWLAESTLILTPLEQDFLDKSMAQRAADEQQDYERQVRLANITKQRQRMLQILVVALIFIALASVAFSVFAFDRETIARNAEATSVANAEEAQNLAQVNGVYAALANNDRELAIALGIAANSRPNPHPFAEKALSDAAYPPGLIHTFVTGLRSSGNLELFDAGRRMLQSFQNNITGEAGVFLWNTDITSSDYGELIRTYPDASGIQPISQTISPDGTRFVTIMGDGRIIYHDLATGELIKEFTRPDDAGPFDILYISWHPDGRRALSGSGNHLIFEWDMEETSPTFGTVLRRFEGHESWVSQVHYSADGSRAISSAWDGLLLLWDTQTANLIIQLSGHTVPVMVARLSPDGQQAASAGSDGEIILWNVDADSPQFGQEIRHLTGHSNLILQMHYSRNSLTLLTSGWDGQLILWNVDTRIQQDAQGDGTSFGVAGSFGTEIVHLEASSSGINGVALSPDGHTAYTAYAMLQAWDLTHGALERNFVWDANSFGAAYSNDGQYAFLGIPHALMILDARTGAIFYEIEDAHRHLIFDIDYNPDAAQLASSGDDGRIRLWDVDPQSSTFGTALREFESSPRVFGNIEFSRDGLYLYGTTLVTGQLFQWDVQTGKILRVYPLPATFLRDFALHPDGRTAVFAIAATPDSEAVYVVLFDLTTGREIRRFNREDASVNSFAFSSDGQLLLSGGGESIVLWDVATGAEIRRFVEGESVNSLAFMPDNQGFAVASENGQITIWNIANGTVTQRIAAHADGILSLAVRPDGQQIVSNTWLESGLWRVNSRSELVAWTQVHRELRDLTCGERVLYYVNPPCDTAGNLPESVPVVLPTTVPVNVPTLQPQTVTVTVPTIAASEPMTITDGTYHSAIEAQNQQTWLYSGQAGQVLTISVIADNPYADKSYVQSNTLSYLDPESFDPVVWIIAPDGTIITLIPPTDLTIANYSPYPGSDDSMDGTVNVAIADLTLPLDGEYEIHISGYEWLSGGAYTLTIEAQ